MRLLYSCHCMCSFNSGEPFPSVWKGSVQQILQIAVKQIMHPAWKVSGSFPKLISNLIIQPSLLMCCLLVFPSMLEAILLLPQIPSYIPKFFNESHHPPEAASLTGNAAVVEFLDLSPPLSWTPFKEVSPSNMILIGDGSGKSKGLGCERM